MDLNPRGIRMHLGLTKPIYQRAAAYGHFDRTPHADGGVSLEHTDLIDALKRSHKWVSNAAISGAIFKCKKKLEKLSFLLPV